jgi:regulator of sirC expression with transglutaminase-like and TPR domain
MPSKKTLTDKDFQLLLSFLADWNEGTVSLVKNQLHTALKTQPQLKKLVTKVRDPHVRDLANAAIDEFLFEELEPLFRALLKKGTNIDLERGIYLLARVQYPELKFSEIAKQFDKMAEAVDRMMAAEQPLPTRPVNAMRRFIFEIQGFEGNEEHYNDPDNTYINKVLDRRTGIPISLACVYLLVGWRLNLLVHGIGLPGHFVIGHRVPRGVIHIDPFHGGRILRKKDCEVLVKRLGIAFKEEHLDPVNNRQILARMIVNLINVYTEQGNTPRAKQMTRLFQLIEE